MIPPSDGSPVKVSIVVATCERLERLKKCAAMVRRHVTVPHEVVVVDGQSTDGTREWLAGQTDLVVILEEQREGAVRAFNKGFRAARGEYVMWLNDDSYPLGGSVEAAIACLERPNLADVGMLAFYHNLDREWNRLDSVEHDGVTYSVYNVRGVPYANFGLLRRSLLEQIGYADERYHFCGWDPDLSLKVQREAGLKVLSCRQALIHHEELIDERKQADMAIIDRDNAKLFAKWQLPAKFSYSDPGPAYRQMLRERGLA